MVPATIYNERDDCAVRALMVAACIDYQTAHDACAAAGRKQKKGMQSADLATAIYRLIPNAKPIMRGETVAQFTRANPRGHFILFVRWHFLAICDGVIHDAPWYSKAPRVRRRILRGWKLV